MALESIRLLTHATRAFTDKCLKDMEANAEVCQRLADYFGVPATAVRVIRGASNNKKTIDVSV